MKKSDEASRCRTCGKPIIQEGNGTYPPAFCSERCQLLDLGAWASESYRLPMRSESTEHKDQSPDSKEVSEPTSRDK